MAKYLTPAALFACLILATESVQAQCSGGGRGGGMGGGVATGFAGGRAGSNFAGNGLATSGFSAGGNPQVFAMMMQMQRQNQMLQQQLVAMRQQMMQLQRQNQQLLAQMQSSDSGNALLANSLNPNARGAPPAGTKLASGTKPRSRPAQ